MEEREARVAEEGGGLPPEARPCWRRVRRRLAALRASQRLFTWLRLPLGSAWDALALLALLLALEIFRRPSPFLRWFLTAAAVAVFSARLASRCRATARGIGGRLDSALRLDRARPSHRDRPTAAVSLARETPERLAGFSQPLLVQLYREAAADLGRVWLVALSPWKRALGETAGILGLYLLALYLPYFTPYTVADAWGRYAARLVSPHASPGVQLAVSPGDLSFRAGEPVEISAEVVGEHDAPPTLAFHSISPDWERQSMQPDSPGRYRATLTGLSTAFQYLVELPGFRSPSYRGTPIEALRLRNLSIQVLPPDYAGGPPEVVRPDAGEIALTAGGKIGWTVQLQELARRVVWQWLVESGPPGAASAPASLRASTSFLPVWGQPEPGNLTWKAQLAPRESGFCELVAEASPPRRALQPFVRRWRVSVHPDQPPQVEITFPGSDTSYPSDGRLLLRYRVRDDHGLARVWFRSRVGQGPEEDVDLHRVGPGQRELEGTYAWALPWPAPSEPIYYALWAEDGAPLSAGLPRAGSSPIYMVGEPPGAAEGGIVSASKATLEEWRQRLQRLERSARSLDERLHAPQGALPKPEEVATLQHELTALRQDDPDRSGSGRRAQEAAGRVRQALEEGDVARARTASQQLSEECRNLVRQAGGSTQSSESGGSQISQLLAPLQTPEPRPAAGSDAPAQQPERDGQGALGVAESPGGAAPGRGPGRPGLGSGPGGAPDKPGAIYGAAAPTGPRLPPAAGRSHTIRSRPGTASAPERTFEPERYPDKYKKVVDRYHTILRRQGG